MRAYGMRTMTKICLALAGGWMGVGNFIMYRMVNFRISSMGTILDVFGNMLGDSNTMFMALLIFLAAGTLAFSLMAAVRVRGAVKKRTARILDEEERGGHTRSLQDSGAKALSKLIDYTTKHYSEENGETMKVLRRRWCRLASTIRVASRSSSSAARPWPSVSPL